VYRDPALRARLEAGARALSADFSWDRIARQTAAFLGNIARKNPDWHSIAGYIG